MAVVSFWFIRSQVDSYDVTAAQHFLLSLVSLCSRLYAVPYFDDIFTNFSRKDLSPPLLL
jgi:hypothetical protein